MSSSDSTRAGPSTSELPSEEKPWEAAQYEAALAHLARLQEQLDGLRAIIPSITAPLMASKDGKAVIFAQLKAGAERSTSNLHTFRDTWTSPETQDILKKAKESLEANADLKMAAGIPKWGWGEDQSEDEQQ